MIILPENVRDYFVVDNQNRLLLHLMNDHRQFVVYVRPLDKAMPLDEQIETFVAADHTEDRAFSFTQKMEMLIVEPVDQVWQPAYLPDTLTVEQYRKTHPVAGAQSV